MCEKRDRSNHFARMSTKSKKPVKINGVVVFQGHAVGTVTGYNRKTGVADQVTLRGYERFAEAGPVDAAFSVVTEADAAALPRSDIDFVEEKGNPDFFFAVRPILVPSQPTEASST